MGPRTTADTSLASPRDSGLPILQAQDGIRPPVASESGMGGDNGLSQIRGGKARDFGFWRAGHFWPQRLRRPSRHPAFQQMCMSSTGCPCPTARLDNVLKNYAGVATVEDGKIGTCETGLRGFAGLVSTACNGIAHAQCGDYGPAHRAIRRTRKNMGPLRHYRRGVVSRWWRR